MQAPKTAQQIKDKIADLEDVIKTYNSHRARTLRITINEYKAELKSLEAQEQAK